MPQIMKTHRELFGIHWKGFTAPAADLGCKVVTFVNRTTGNAETSHTLGTRVDRTAEAWASTYAKPWQDFVIGEVSLIGS